MCIADFYRTFDKGPDYAAFHIVTMGAAVSERTAELFLSLEGKHSLVVVEHDPAVMMAADRMIDMGPGPGEKGGQIVFDGSTEALKGADTLTGAYLGGRKQVGMGFKRMVGINTPRLVLEGATEHNLKDVSIEIPLQRLVCITGVSGSGKSSLAFDTIYAEGQRRYVETFSPYARQFLERMDKPQVDAIRGIPPAIAIDQTNHRRRRHRDHLWQHTSPVGSSCCHCRPFQRKL